MRFLLGWLVKLGFLSVVYLTMTGDLKLKLPETVLGYEVPPVAQQWVDRNAQITEFGKQTQDSFKQISDSLNLDK
jgi:hypothetical protein